MSEKNSVKYTIKVAEKAFQVRGMYMGAKEYCARYHADEEADSHVEITPQDIDFERKISAQEDAVEGNPVRHFTDEQLEITAVQRKIAEKMFDYDTLVFHGSVIAVDGEAYLFTAKSGTGKSTHTALWRQLFGSRAVMINDDKPFLRIEEQAVIAYGSPWNGKHGLGTNTGAPLKAICVLERGVQNEICAIPPKEAVYLLLQQSNRPMDRRKMPVYLDLVDRLSRNVRFYRLKCNMHPEAAIKSYEAMSGKMYGEVK